LDNGFVDAWFGQGSVSSRTGLVKLLLLNCLRRQGNGFNLVESWFQVGQAVVSTWSSYGFSLVKFWFQLGQALVSLGQAVVST